MVSSLHRFTQLSGYLKWCTDKLGLPRSKCYEQWKGPGWYYHRGKGYIVKYNAKLDAKHKCKSSAPTHMVGWGKWRHTHDLPATAVLKLREAAKKHAKRHAKRIERKLVREGVKRKEAHRIAHHAVVIAVINTARKAKRESKTVERLARRLWRRIPDKYKEGKHRVWTYVAVYNLAREIVRLSKKKGVDPLSRDWTREIDWAAGYEEAEKRVKRELGHVEHEITEKDVREFMKHQRKHKVKVRNEIDEWELKQLFS